MIEAFANHLSSHLGRHLLYWAIDTSNAGNGGGTSGNYGLNLRLSELINKFHGPLERGVQVLDHLLTLEEDDFTGHWGSAYAHSYEPEYADRVPENEELPPPEHSKYYPKIGFWRLKLKVVLKILYSFEKCRNCRLYFNSTFLIERSIF